MTIRHLFIALLASLAGITLGAQAACPPEPAVPTPEQIAGWAGKAPDRGVLWRISRDGHSSYLFGSLHVGKAQWIVPGPALRAAWADTEVLALELDPADVLPALAKMPPPPPLPEKLALRMQAQVRAACLPEGALSTLPLMLQLSTLTLFEARRDGLDAGFGQEMMLLGLAKAEGRPVQSLETVEEQLAALSGGEQEMALLDAGLRQLQQGQVRGPLRKLAEVWSRGDLQTLADYRRWCNCADTPAERDWIKRLNDDRNLQLAGRIDALHAAGQRLFVAVGALHMSGPEALPRLLAARGFEVQALVPARPASK
jgi:uncharacterized protein YbaP (TraB family)